MSKRLKVLIVIPSLGMGGMEIVCCNYVNELVSRGHNVTVITINGNLTIINRLDKRVSVESIAVPALGIKSKLPYFRNYYNEVDWMSTFSAKKLYNYVVKGRKFDVEIAFCRNLPVKIISGSTNKNAIKIAWIHNDISKCSDIPGVFGTLSNMKKAYQKFDYRIFVSETARRIFEDKLDYHSDSNLVIYNPLDIERIKKSSEPAYALDKTVFNIVSVGRLTEAKGYDILLKACKMLMQEGHGFHLTIVGDGAIKQDLQEYANQNRIPVTFVGLQENPYPYINAADLYVCSSRWEGYNLTVAEALILHKPIVSTDCTGPNEILDNGKYGMIVECNETAIADGIRKLMDDNILREGYIEKSFERESFFDLSNAVDKFERVVL